MPAPDRLKGLVDAGIALGSELSLDALLKKLAETAAELTSARYAALGVIDERGQALERFVFTGLEPDVAEAIGELPHGRGVLGALITDAKPLRLENIADDPRSVGFPPHHPPMRTFLGVPVVLRGRAYGNLYLTEKEGGVPFTKEDEELVTLLASQAAVAVENARLYEAATRWSRRLEALNDVGNALTAEVQLQPLLELITERLRDLIGARLVTIALPIDEGKLRLEAVAGVASAEVMGLTMDLDRSKSGRVLARGKAERVDSLVDDPEVDQDTARQLGAQSALYVPLVTGRSSIGVLIAHDKEGPDPRFGDDDLRLAETFARRAAVAVDLSKRVASDALRRVVEAQEVERRRLARELHDQTGQELTSVLLGLRAVEEAATDEERAATLSTVREQVVETLHDVRRLAVELRPKALDDFGLVPALERLRDTFADQTGMRVEFVARLTGRLPSDVETALYRIVQEALTNVVKHAGARSVSIVLSQGERTVSVLIEDDGRGFTPDLDGDGMGLVGMRERLALLGGRLKLESGADGGATIVAEVPLR